ncbi:hypothetical protein OAK03_03235 [Gammaproteobacteria bacterium]|nr:hypothetical protein [Gammaproteobacteria bacterium]
MKTKVIRILKWVGAFLALFITGIVEAEIYNQIALRSSESYQSGWHFVSVFAVLVPISVLSGVIALFGNMKRFTSSPLRLFTIWSQGFMFFFWFNFIAMILVF